MWLTSLALGCGFALAQKYKSLEDVYGGVARVTHMQPLRQKSARLRSAANPHSRLDAINTTDCGFPLEIVVIQDLTQSMQDDTPTIIAGLERMYRSVRTTHPDTQIAITSFQDKPIWPLGSEDLYCARVDVPFLRSLDTLKRVYASLLSRAYGGGDPPEAQFHAIVGAATSNFIGWQNPVAVKIIIIVTDGAPHFAGDGFNTMDLPDFVMPNANRDLNEACATTYYPSPDQVVEALRSRGAYLGMLVTGGEEENGRVGGSWKWFNSYYGQIDSFYQDLPESAKFREKVETIIGVVETLECGGTPSTSTPDPSASQVSSTEVTTTPPLTGSTNAERDCGGCKDCRAFGCTCCCGITANCPYKDAKTPKRMFVKLAN